MCGEWIRFLRSLVSKLDNKTVLFIHAFKESGFYQAVIN